MKGLRRNDDAMEYYCWYHKKMVYYFLNLIVCFWSAQVIVVWHVE